MDMKNFVMRVSLILTMLFAGIAANAQSVEPVNTSTVSGNGVYWAIFLIVFLILFAIYFIFKIVNRFVIGRQKKNAEVEGTAVVHKEISGEVFAAISMALHLYETEQHDFESTVLTINRAAKMYSPWSSKIYGLRQTPQKESRSATNKR